MTTRRQLLALILLASHGCSWAFVATAPSSATPGQVPPIVCTESRNAPIADTVLAIVAVVATGNLYVTCNADDARENGCTSTWSIGLLYGAGIAILNGLSAEYGYRHTSRCRRVHAQPATTPLP